jgi:hypothetical protein
MERCTSSATRSQSGATARVRKVESWAEPSAVKSQKFRPSITVSLEYSVSLVSKIACSFLVSL